MTSKPIKPLTYRFDKKKRIPYIAQVVGASGITLFGIIEQPVASLIIGFGLTFWLIERKEYQLWRMLFDRNPQLEVACFGVSLKRKKQPVKIPWKEITALRFGVREMEDESTNKGLYIYTSSIGSFCLPVDEVDFAHYHDFQQEMLAWWKIAHDERVRKRNKSILGMDKSSFLIYEGKSRANLSLFSKVDWIFT